MPPLVTPLAGSKFTLSWAGVAGLFGGEEAVSAVATIHLYEGRRWLGWFNSPGSYMIAKHFIGVARSRSRDALFLGMDDPPAVLRGVKYISALSGTTTLTGNLAHLTMKRCKEVEAEEIPGRLTKAIDVAYLAVKPVDYDIPVKRLPLKSALFGLIPITVSVVTCVMCALVYDWYCSSMILLGIVSSGCASFVVGKGRLVIKPTTHAPPSSRGHPDYGVLVGEDEVVVIKGEAWDVNAITKGRFHLEPDPKYSDEEKGITLQYHAIGLCSILLFVQFFLQLLLVPQGSQFGQIMFLVSLGVSWGYNTYLSTLLKEKIQMHFLFQKLGNPEVLRFRTGTRATAAVFICLLLFHGVKGSSPEEDRALRTRVLHLHLPISDAPIWKQWREKVVQQLLNIYDESESLPYLEEDDWEQKGFNEPEGRLLNVLLGDAATAFKGYFNVRKMLSGRSDYEERLDTRHGGGSEGFIYFRLEERK